MPYFVVFISHLKPFKKCLSFSPFIHIIYFTLLISFNQAIAVSLSRCQKGRIFRYFDSVKFMKENPFLFLKVCRLLIV